MMPAKGSYRLMLTWGDKLLIGGLLVLSLLSIAVVDRLAGTGSLAVVEVAGQESSRLDLSVDGQRVIKGLLGDTIVQVREGKVRVVKSACPHKICVRTGWVSKSGNLIVCVPNRVVVRVEGEGEVDVDAVTW